MMMASAADDVTSQETVEDEMGMAAYEEPKENAKFSMAHTANEDGIMPESAEEEMVAYDGDMINALVLESDDEESVLKTLEKYAEENGFDVGVGGNKIVIYADRDISAEVKELIGSMAQIAEDDAVEGTEYNVVEIEIR